MAAFDSAFGHGFLKANTEVAGSLWRLAQGKLFRSDKYLQKSGARIDRDQRVRHDGARAVGQVIKQHTNPL
ncbi:hypothetical protein [Pseudomonas sp. McL0111]|uniref:hypothetical protein n=1 Tax=Pseudomonas sp. McL0111 TaxID=3457357 RepID=UPI00403EA456